MIEFEDLKEELEQKQINDECDLHTTSHIIVDDEDEDET